jgi:hypothetical protein
MDSPDAARIFGERYVLGDRLTAGATREVWQAHDDVVSRAVALKIFFGPDAASPDWQQTFRRRADRMVALSHPGIAKVYDHGESSDETWLAMAFVPGAPLADRLGGGEELSPQQALDTIGQTALALAAAHTAGIVHGNLSTASLLVRGGGVVSIIGFAVDGNASRDDDLDALVALTTTLLDTDAVSTSPHSSDVKQFMTSLHAPDRGARPRDASEIGRTALALATSLRGDDRPAALAPSPAPSRASARAEAIRFESSQAEAERKLVRNRLIVLGTIVVVGGAGLLRFVGEGAGDVTVPLVTNLTIDQAELKLTTDGMRSSEHCTLGRSSGDVVVRQSPAAGRSVKAGSVVTLTYTKDTCP